MDNALSVCHSHVLTGICIFDICIFDMYIHINNILRHGDRTKAIQPLRYNHHVFKFRDFEFLLLVQCNFSLRLIDITV